MDNKINQNPQPNLSMFNNSQPVQQQQPIEYPPSVQYTTQEKPTHLEFTGLKYNAFNIDKLSVDIMNKGGFDKITPDLVIWNYYKYKVDDLHLNANETELSNFFNWTVRNLGLKDMKLDFHDNNKVTCSGKYGVIPFSAELSLSLTKDKKVLIDIGQIKCLVTMPNIIRDKIIDSLLNGPEDPPNPALIGDAFSLRKALVKVSDNQLLLDLNRMPTPVDIKFDELKTTENGIIVEGSDQ